MWKDPWINKLPLQNHLIGPLPQNEENQIVSSIISNLNDTSYWNLDSLPFTLPQSILDQILSIVLLNPQ